MALEPRRQLLVSRGWVQAVAIVMIFDFTVMGMLAYRTYTGEPPIPARVTDDSGHVLFTRGDILAGQAVFLRNGLMEYGSIFGHGAYLGPDFTADHLLACGYGRSMRTTSGATISSAPSPRMEGRCGC